MEDLIKVCVENGLGIASFLFLMLFIFKYQEKNNALLGKISDTMIQIQLNMASMQQNMAEMTDRIEKIEYKGYCYQHIRLDGEMWEQEVSGNLTVEDENIRLAINGLADWSEEDTRLDLTLKLADFRPATLHLIEKYPELELGATTYVSLYTSGAKSEMLDNMTGYVIVDTLLLRNGEKQTTMKQFKLFLCILCTSLLGACISEPTPSDTNHVVRRILTRSSNTEEIISEGQTALFNIFKDSKAIIENFVNGTPVEDTINSSTDIFDFQLIAKAGSKYKEAYHLVDGIKESVQKVNRVYATADTRYGKLYKIKAENEQIAKIEMLPEHCIIDNDNKLTINEVDKTFYIELAKKRINDFLGIKPEKKGRKKKMATKKETTTAPADMNIWQKLLCVRDEFARAEVKRSGKNMQLSSLFYELTDIVPVARPMFNNYRLLPLVTVASGKATMTIVDVDFPEEKLVFELDVQTYDGNKAVTPPQAYGAVVTYYRRYLYMIALDIVEADYLENNITPPEVKETTPVETPKTTIPVAPTTTEKPLASGEAQADELQISQLKKVFGELLKADPTKEEMIAQIAVQTQSFTVISKVQCEALIAKATELVKEVTQ